MESATRGGIRKTKHEIATHHYLATYGIAGDFKALPGNIIRMMKHI